MNLKMQKVVNNFNQIGSMLDWPNEDIFYFAQIMVRRKDNPNIGPDNKILRDIYIESRQKFIDKQEEISGFCEYFGARCYIHLNKRSKKDVAFEALKIMADRMSKGEYQSLRSIYATACGQKMSDSSKKWVLDLDIKDEDIKLQILNKLKDIQPIGNKFICEIPTVNGIHLITDPFNTETFAYNFNHLTDDKGKKLWDIQKNNPTLLYAHLK